MSLTTNHSNSEYIVELKQYAERLTFNENPELSFNTRKIIVQQIYNLTDSIEMLNGILPEKHVHMDRNDAAYMISKLLYDLRTGAIQYLDKDTKLTPEAKNLMTEKLELLLTIKNDNKKLKEFIAAMKEEEAALEIKEEKLPKKKHQTELNSNIKTVKDPMATWFKISKDTKYHALVNDIQICTGAFKILHEETESIQEALIMENKDLACMQCLSKLKRID